MESITFLHVAAMFMAVAASLGPAYVLQRIGRKADVPTIRSAFALTAPLLRIAPILYIVGGALGVVAIFTSGFDPFAPFLLIAYLLFALATVVGIRFNGPWMRRVVRLSAESPDHAASPELTAALRDPSMRWVDWFDRIIVVAFIFDMVVKPFS